MTFRSHLRSVSSLLTFLSPWHKDGLSDFTCSPVFFLYLGPVVLFRFIVFCFCFSPSSVQLSFLNLTILVVRLLFFLLISLCLFIGVIGCCTVASNFPFTMEKWSRFLSDDIDFFDDVSKDTASMSTPATRSSATGGEHRYPSQYSADDHVSLHVLEIAVRRFAIMPMRVAFLTKAGIKQWKRRLQADSIDGDISEWEGSNYCDVFSFMDMWFIPSYEEVEYEG